MYCSVRKLYVKSSESCLRDENMMYIGGGQDSEFYGIDAEFWVLLLDYYDGRYRFVFQKSVF